MRILKTKIQEKFENIWSRFVEGVAILAPIGSHINKNEKNVKIKTLKNSKRNFVRILETKFRRRFQKIRERFVGGVAF